MTVLTGLVVNTKGDLLRFDNAGSGTTASLQTIKDGSGVATALGLSSIGVSAANVSFSGNTISSTSGALTVNSTSGTNNFGTSTGAIVTLGNATGTTAINGTVSFGGGLSLTNATFSGTVTTLNLTATGTTTLTAPIFATISNTGLLTLPTSTDTLIGRATTDTLTNKTLTSPVLTTPVVNGTITGTTVISVANGGTALASYTQGDILYASGSGVLATLPKDTNATRYLSNTGTTNNPAWAQINIANGVTGTLPVANGGTGVIASNPCLQRVGNLMTTNLSGTTAMPLDNTKPQITEGDQYLSQAITPKSATSILEIDISLVVTAEAAHYISGALFQDATANALAATTVRITAADQVSILTLKYFMTSGTTSATTFKFRAGVDASGTCYVNTISTTALFNGVCTSSISIKEWVS